MQEGKTEEAQLKACQKENAQLEKEVSELRVKLETASEKTRTSKHEVKLRGHSTAFLTCQSCTHPSFSYIICAAIQLLRKHVSSGTYRLEGPQWRLSPAEWLKFMQRSQFLQETSSGQPREAAANGREPINEEDDLHALQEELQILRADRSRCKARENCRPLLPRDQFAV